jgi:hypothetical protein
MLANINYSLTLLFAAGDKRGQGCTLRDAKVAENEKKAVPLIPLACIAAKTGRYQRRFIALKTAFIEAVLMLVSIPAPNAILSSSLLMPI